MYAMTRIVQSNSNNVRGVRQLVCAGIASLELAIVPNLYLLLRPTDYCGYGNVSVSKTAFKGFDIDALLGSA